MDDLDDWETAADEPIVPPVVQDVVNQWEDEDEDDDDLLDSWDAPPPEKKEATPAPKPPAKNKKLLKQKLAEKERKLEMEARARAERMSEAEKMAEKLQAQKAVEEADNKLTEELFMGVSIDDNVDAIEKNVGVRDYVLKKDEDFENFVKEVADKMNAEANGLQKVDFLKTLLKEVCADMKLDDVNSVKSYMNVIYNDVRKSEVGKKKKNKKKATLKTARGYDDFGDDNAYVEDDDDFDFI